MTETEMEVMNILGYEATVSVPDGEPVTGYFTDREFRPKMEALVAYIDAIKAGKSSEQEDMTLPPPHPMGDRKQRMERAAQRRAEYTALQINHLYEALQEQGFHAPGASSMIDALAQGGYFNYPDRPYGGSR